MATYLMTHSNAAAAPVVHVQLVYYTTHERHCQIYGIYSDRQLAQSHADRLKTLSHVADAWVNSHEVIQPSE
jgi:hypothetical protein